MSDSVRPYRRQPIRLPRPWDSPGNNTGVGCHFLLQCMKVKSESEVAQSCLSLSDPMDCSLPGSSIHGIFQARVLEWGADFHIYPFLIFPICFQKTLSKKDFASWSEIPELNTAKDLQQLGTPDLQSLKQPRRTMGLFVLLLRGKVSAYSLLQNDPTFIP